MNPGRMKTKFVLAAGWFLVAKAHAQTTTAIEHVALIDVVAALAKPVMTVVIAGNKIAAAGPASEVETPHGARSVDGRGKFLIPGSGRCTCTWETPPRRSCLLISYRITGVRDMGSPSISALRRWRVEALTSVRVGPRIMAAGPILTEGPPYFQSICLSFDVVHLKRGERDSLLKHRFLKSSRGRVRIRFKHQLHIRVTIRRNNGEPPEFPNRNVLGLLEAQYVGIEREGGCLILDHNAAEFDFHSLRAYQPLSRAVFSKIALSPKSQPLAKGSRGSSRRAAAVPVVM
jgi:hypothetical protein